MFIKSKFIGRVERAKSLQKIRDKYLPPVPKVQIKPELRDQEPTQLNKTLTKLRSVTNDLKLNKLGYADQPYTYFLKHTDPYYKEYYKKHKK